MKNTCPCCGEGTLTDLCEISDVGVPLVYSVCDVCGADQVSVLQQVMNSAAQLAYIRHTEGK